MKNKTIIKAFMIVFMVTTFIMLCIFLNRNWEQLLNSDDASEMMLAKLLSQTGGVLSKEWFYSTEIRVLNTQLIRIPLFYLTSDWHLIHIVGNIVAYLLLLGGIFFFCKANRIDYWFPLLGGLILLPISSYYFENILKGIYYIPHILISCILLSLLIYYGEKQAKHGYSILIVSGLLSVLAGMGGLRQPFIFHIPIILAVGVFYWIYRDEPKKVVPYLVYSVINIACVIAGYVVNRRILARTYSFQNRESIHYVRIWAETVFRMLNTFLFNLGYKLEDSIFSFDTINNLSVAFLVILSWFSIVNVIRKREEYTEGNLITILYFLSGLIICLVFFSGTDMYYLPTYTLPILFFTIPVIFIGVGNYPAKGHALIRKNVAIWSMTLLVSIYGIHEYKNIEKNMSNEFIEIAQFLEENGYENGYSNFWDGNVLTELTEGKINAWVWGDLMDDVRNLDTVYEWLQYKSHLKERPAGKTYVLLEQEENEIFSISKYFQESDVILKTQKHIIYGFDSNDILMSKIAQ